jgi:hypothetical protein
MRVQVLGVVLALGLLAACGGQEPVAAPPVAPVVAVVTTSAADAPTMQACREYENELTASGLVKFDSQIRAGGKGVDLKQLSTAENRFVPVEGRAAIPRVADSLSAFNGIIALISSMGRR